MSYNSASYTGDTSWNIGLMQLNYRAESACNSVYNDNKKYNSNYIKNIADYNTTFSKIVGDNKIADKCVNYETIHSKILELCCDDDSFQDICKEEGYLKPEGQSLTSSCPAELKALKNKSILKLKDEKNRLCHEDNLFIKRNITYISKLSYIPDEMKEYYDIEGEIYKESLATYSLFHSSHVPSMFPTSYIDSNSVPSDNLPSNEPSDFSIFGNNHTFSYDTEFTQYNYTQPNNLNSSSPYFSFTNSPPSEQFLSSHYLHKLPVWNSKSHGNIILSNFECKNFNTCDLNCNVINKNNIKVTTRNCSCLSEFYLYSNLIKFFLIFIIFIISNFARVLIIQGNFLIFFFFFNFLLC